MLLFANAMIYVASLTVTKNAEGTKIKKFDFENPLESFPSDVQPNVLTRAQIELYGIDAKTANTKKCFCDIGNGNYMTPGNRVKVIYNRGGKAEFYNVQPTNDWNFHKEFLLIPVENEK